MAELLSSLGGGALGGAGGAGGAIDGITGAMSQGGAGASQGLLGANGAQSNPMQGLLGDMTAGEQGEVFASLDQRNKGSNSDRAKMAEQNPYAQDMSQAAMGGQGIGDLAKLMAFAQMRR